MINDITSVKIGAIWNAGSGATFKETLEATPDFGPEIKLASPLQANLMMVRMKDGLTTIIEDLTTSSEFSCVRCLESFTLPIKAKSSERQFYEIQPERDFDPFEYFLIDRQRMSIDLTEVLRQEIILHFPMIPVCSKRCRGLCPGCRINLNHTDEHKPGCTAPQIEESDNLPVNQHKPFAHLKEMLEGTPKKK